MEEILNKVEFNSFKELLKIIDPLVDKVTPQEFLDFINGLDRTKLSNLIKNPKESNRMNFLEAMLYRHTRDDLRIIKRILELIGNEYYDYLLNNVIDNDGYITLTFLEFLVYIDSRKMRYFLDNTRIKIKFEFSGDIKWDFHLFLYILLLCYSPEELMIYLEKNHRYALFKIVLPEMHWFDTLKMSTQSKLDMKHFITAFFLETVRSEIYFKNLDKLGLFLADIMLTELSDGYNENKEEINLRVIRALDWVGGEAEEKLNALSRQYDIEKYRDLLY